MILTSPPLPAAQFQANFHDLTAEREAALQNKPRRVENTSHAGFLDGSSGLHYLYARGLTVSDIDAGRC